MTEQEENELICEKLLGWKKGTFEGTSLRRWDHEGKLICGPQYGWTPSFTTWADSGMILDWLMSHVGPGLTSFRDDIAFNVRNRTLTPAIVRAAALAYIPQVKS
jgi:hypothetical protein